MNKNEISDLLGLDMTLGDPEAPERPKEFAELKPGQMPIDLLVPGSDHANYVLNYLNDQIRTSEEAMSKFYPRWQIAERKMQAYLSLPNYEQMLRDMNNSSKPPAPAIIMFPYKYAVVSTIVTYGMKVFTANAPYFPLGADSKEQADLVRYAETMLQRHLEATKIVARIWQLLLDGEIYGCGIMRCLWRTKYGNRRIVRPLEAAEKMMLPGDANAQAQLAKDVERRVVWAGNEIMNIDPFMFLPDPNVPMAEVSEKGEYVYWREFVGKHVLMRAQAEGLLKYVDQVQESNGIRPDNKWSNLSHRSALSGGESHAGEGPRAGRRATANVYQMDQGSVEIVPAELGLGPETTPQKWLFTVLNGTTIVQAEPLDYDHGRHPVEISEPYTLGYGFGSPALGDYIGPVQDILSWFIDSHIYNVRAALNNQWVYDPSKIDEKSLKYPQPGKHIRLKPLAYGTDVRQAIQQVPVSDVTRGHINDLATFTRIGDMVSAVNDTSRGVQPAGGRRTAAETRIVGESAFGRLGAHCKLISQQALSRIAEQCILNIQQMQTQDIWTKVIGQEAMAEFGQRLLTADFTYPVHDGTLPLDRAANFDLWKEILFGMAKSQILQRTHSFPRVFEHVAKLGGAENISSFRLVGDAEMDQMVQQGNAIAAAQAAAGAPPAAGTG